MDDPSQPVKTEGGVVMVTEEQSPEEPPVVVPSQAPPVNPFIPQGTPNTTVSDAEAKPPRKGIGGFVKKILLFVIIAVVLVVAVRFAMGMIAKNREVTITYWGLWENDAIVRSVISDFEAKNPKIKVTYVKQSHKQYRERLQAAIGREEGPDVFRYHNTWVPMLVRDLMPVPTDVMSASQFASAFYPVAGGDLVAGSTIYGIPLMIDGLGLYYNEELLASAGVSLPVTWEDVLAMTPMLTVKNDQEIITSAIALGSFGNVEHASDILATMMLQNGAKLTDLTSKESEEALIFYRKFADPSDPVYTWNKTLDNSVYAFATGRVAMILAPSWRALEIQQINPDIKFQIAPIPQLPGNMVTWASYWVEGVSTKSKHTKEAWKFVSYLTSREGATKLFTEASKTRLFGEPYARVELGSLLADDPYLGAFISQAATARSFPLASRTFDNGINDKLIKYLEDAINSVEEGSAPSAALEIADRGFRQVLGSYGLTSSTPAQP